MRSTFPLYQSHLDLAHFYWKQLLIPGDIVIDATCGNGKDTLFLAQLAIKNGEGQIFAHDVQPEALESTKIYLEKYLTESQMNQIIFVRGCHSTFSDRLKKESVKLIVYNLGYLPGGNKEKTTLWETTLTSLRNACSLISLGGAISITCYPGHSAGALEEEKIISFTRELSPKDWNCCFHQWVNRSSSPSLILLQKTLT